VDEDEDGIEYAEELGDDELAAACLIEPYRRNTFWSLASLTMGVVKNIMIDLAQGLLVVENIFSQRAAWEEERQEFSDSVKSDFLAIKALEPEAVKEDTEE
jgi:hypothetical protein